MWIVLLRILGILILALVATQLGVQLLQLLSRFSAGRRLNRIKIDQMRLEIERLRGAHASDSASTPAWEGWRKFRIQKKVAEGQDCHSYYFVPHDGKPLPTYRPGQYLTLRLKVPGEDKAVVRCYSLSAAPHPEYFRCTVKKVLAPENAVGVPSGKCSTYLNEVTKEGELVDLKSPRGAFYLDEQDQRPVVLLAAGVGITPIFSMLELLTQRRDSRDLHLFYGVRNSAHHVFKESIQAIVDRHQNVTLTTSYSSPLADDQLGRDYDLEGHLSVDALKQRLPSKNFVFYICGPPGFMSMAVEGLKEWGVPESDIKTETFGPSAAKSAKPKQHQGVVEAPGAINGNGNGHIQVVFDRSNKNATWEPTFGSLLELAESIGVEIETGCRAGNCGTCAVAVKAGSIDYHETPDGSCEDGSCLACVAFPKDKVVLDA